MIKMLCRTLVCVVMALSSFAQSAIPEAKNTAKTTLLKKRLIAYRSYDLDGSNPLAEDSVYYYYSDGHGMLPNPFGPDLLPLYPTCDSIYEVAAEMPFKYYRGSYIFNADQKVSDSIDYSYNSSNRLDTTTEAEWYSHLRYSDSHS